jgi:hypothetical protein
MFTYIRLVLRNSMDTLLNDLPNDQPAYYVPKMRSQNGCNS